MKRHLYRFSPNALRSIYQRIEASPLGYRLAKGAFWSLAGSLISRGLGLISAIIVGRMLGKHGFGELGIIQSTVGLFGTVAGFGMGMMTTKYLGEFKRSDPAKAGRIIGLASVTTWTSSGIMAALLLVFAPWIAAHTMAAPQLEGLLRIGSLLLLLGGVNGAQSGTLAGFEAFKLISRINLITGVLAFPMMVVGAWSWGVTGALWGMVGNSLVNCMFNWFAMRAEARKAGVPFGYTSCWREWTIFWRFNLPGVLNGILYAFVGWACGALLVRQVDGFGDMGVFNAAMRIKQLPEILVGMMMAPLLPILSEAFGRKDFAAYGKTLQFTYAICTLLMVPVSLLQMAVPWLTLLPYGKAYQNGEPVVQWLMVGSVAYSLLYPMGSILISMGRMWLALWLGILYVVSYLGLGFWLIPKYGAAGYAAAGTGAFILANLPCVYILYSQFGPVMRQVQWAIMFGLATCLLGGCWMISVLHSRSLATAAGLVAAFAFAGWWLVTGRRMMSQKATDESSIQKETAPHVI